MCSYIEEALRFYGKKVRDCITPENLNLFTIKADTAMIVEKAKFHSVVAKLLYLGRRGRPDICFQCSFYALESTHP
jgi:rRNA pseudouridine-1189 N-methylase Emg1 (Nep1/Mra1 family)